MLLFWTEKKNKLHSKSFFGCCSNDSELVKETTYVKELFMWCIIKTDS